LKKNVVILPQTGEKMNEIAGECHEKPAPSAEFLAFADIKSALQWFWALY
jgi:hypothetical protein